MLMRLLYLGLFLAAFLSTAAAEDADEETLRQAKEGFAAEVYPIISKPLSERLTDKDIGKESQDLLLYKATAYVSDCVITDLAEKPMPMSKEFIQTLAELPPAVTARETMRLRYGNEDAETLWFNVDYVLDQCVGRVYELLGLDE